MKSCVAYVDDSPSNLECIEVVLTEDFEVETFQEGEKFLKKYSDSSYACIIMDIHMPKMDGFSLFERVVQHPNYNGCPILFISSDDSDEARIKSFALGAVDFLNRHMRPAELVARVNSKIEFYKKHRSIIEFSNLKVNLTLIKAYIDNKELGLTFIEFKILCHVLRSYPDPLAKEQIVEYIWNSGHVLDATIHTHVSNLNGKLEDWDHEILGLKNVGIQLAKKKNK